jgi:Tfp pilus assembly protein PilF
MTQFTVQQAIELAVQQHRAGKLAEAEAIYRQIMAQAPARHDVSQRLAEVLYQAGKPEQSLELLHRAVEADPGVADYHANLAMILCVLSRFAEAIPEFERALAIRPDTPATYSNMANALRETGQLDAAETSLRRALSLRPNYPEAEWNLSYVLLTQGKLREGFTAYEARLRVPNFPNRPFERPKWDGSDLTGRTILLYSEQGVGDTIQFIRYAPMVKQRGGRIVVFCPPELRSLFSGRLGIEQIVCDYPLPDFDFYCPIPSLPNMFGTTLETIPGNVPYLAADPRLAQNWRERLGTGSPGLKIGLVWAGSPTHRNDRNRSMPLAALAPLAAVQGVQWISLQKGPASAQLREQPHGLAITDWTEELKDYADTAALIASLDLVISVDTSVAHLAGALGRPVWLLNAFAPDWRWLWSRPDSPWYPTMRIYRQPKMGGWRIPVEQIVEDLNRQTQNRA